MTERRSAKRGKGTVSNSSNPEDNPKACPKCGSMMAIQGSCPKCHYSAVNAYHSLREAKEFTHPG